MAPQRLAAVTGGTGFIGRRLVGLLLEQGWRVRVLSRSPQAPRPGVEVLQGDLLGSLPAAIAEADTIFHCAGELKDPRRMRSLHVDGTARLLDLAVAAARARSQPLHWVQLSSVGAYGPVRAGAAPLRVTEDSPEAPVGDYEETKTLADLLVRKRAGTEPLLTATLLRPSNVFGAGMPNDSVRALLRAAASRWFFYIGRHEPIATYVHVDDVARALAACGSHPAARGRTYNLSNDCLLRDIVQAVRHAAGVPAWRPRLPEQPVRLAAGLASLVLRHPLTASRIDALTRRVAYGWERLGETGFRPEAAVPLAMADFYRAEVGTIARSQ